MRLTKSVRFGVSLLFAVGAYLTAAKTVSAQNNAPIRYVFGTNSYTDSKGQLWSPVPTSEFAQATGWHWSSCATTANFTGTPDPGLYRQQLSEDSSDLILSVPVPNGSYTVNLYFAEPCYTFTPGGRVFSVALNGTTIIPKLDLTATAGVLKPVIESAQITGSGIVLDLKRITNSPMIAAIEILPLSTSFQVAANLKWDDGTVVAGTINVFQQISANPPASKSLGAFTLDPSGAVAASLTPDLTLPLTFSFTLVNPAGTAVNTLGFSCDSATMKMFPRSLNTSIVLNKASATLKSFSF